MTIAPSPTRRATSKMRTSLLKAIDHRPEERVVVEVWQWEPPHSVREEKAGGRVYSKPHSQIVIALHFGQHRRVFRQRQHLLLLGRSENGRDRFPYLAALVPCRLSQEQPVGYGVVLANARRRGGVVGGFVIVFVRRNIQRKFVAHNIDLAAGAVILLDLRQDLHMVQTAGGALEIAEDIEADGRRRIAERLILVG